MEGFFISKYLFWFNSNFLAASSKNLFSSRDSVLSFVAIFNNEFSDRILIYNCDIQSVNDVYSLAGKTFFQSSLVDKYDGLSEKLVDVLKSILSDENHQLTDDEKKDLHTYFKGIAWALAQKGT